MKKILGFSLCALFAVSAANAEITSRGYVDQVVGANTTRINTLDTAIAGMNQNQTQGDYVTFVKQEGGQVTASGASFATNVATGGTSAPTSAAVVAYVEGQVNELEVGNLADRVAANESAIGENATKIATNTSDIATNATNIQTNKTNIQTNTGNITTLTGRVDGHDTSIAGLTQQVGINEGKINTLDEDIQAMELTATTGDYVKVVSQSNGTVHATGASFDTSVSDTSNNAPTSKAVAGHVATYVTNNAVQAVVEGGTNGTISVDGTEVAVHGLQAMAYKAAVTNLDITDETITNADISPTAAILSSKISFTREQANALNSGITSDLVGKITTNETNIGNNARNITDMGTQVTANKESITNLTTGLETANQKIQNNATAINANTASINSILNATGIEACNTSAGCTLVHDSTGFKWEAVTREVSAQ